MPLMLRVPPGHYPTTWRTSSAGYCPTRSSRPPPTTGGHERKRSPTRYHGPTTTPATRHPSNWRHAPGRCAARPRRAVWRSEEHTSELQSRGHLVCRLLLEKKKNNTKKVSDI